MRSRLVFGCALVLLAVALPMSAEPAPDALFLPAPEVAASGSDGAGCVLMDVAVEEGADPFDAIRAAGFTPPPTNAQLPQCPTPFACSSIGNCAAGPLCALTDIGPCCQVSPGLIRCCLNGTIKVTRCPCRCTATLCAIACIQSANVTSVCS